MEYRVLGRTGLKVSQIGLGCEGFIDKSEEEVKAFVTRAEELGINFIDLYSPNPILRSCLGNAIKHAREKWILEAHLSTIWKNEQYLRIRKIEEVKIGFEDLLKRLQTDYIDIGMIHYVDAQQDFDEVFNGEIIEYAKALKDRGKIKYIGLSSHNPIVAMKAIESGLIDVLLFSINPCYDMLPASEDIDDLWKDENYAKPLTNIDPDCQALYEMCAREGVAITVMKAFGGGDLLDEKLSPFGIAMTTHQCIHYCLTRPAVASVMAGAHTIEEMELSASYCYVSEEEKDFALVLSHIPKHSFIGNCVYCGHCAPCAKGIDIASVHKFLDLCVAQGEIPETVREHYKALKHHASECIECGSCMRNCPFQVHVIEKMKKAVEIFGY